MKLFLRWKEVEQSGVKWFEQVRAEMLGIFSKGDLREFCPRVHGWAFVFSFAGSQSSG